MQSNCVDLPQLVYNKIIKEESEMTVLFIIVLVGLMIDYKLALGFLNVATGFFIGAFLSVLLTMWCFQAIIGSL